MKIADGGQADITMAAGNHRWGLLQLPKELRDEIYENLFSQGEVLHLPEPERATIEAAGRSCEEVSAELEAYEKYRRETSRSKREQYTKCIFTVYPDGRSTFPTSPREWPCVKDLEIVLDDLTLQNNYRGCEDELLRSQIAEMRAVLKHFVAWVNSRSTAIESMRIRFTHSDEDAPVLDQRIGKSNFTVMWLIIEPLLDLPVCEKVTVEQSEEARARILGVDEGLDRVVQLGNDDLYQMEVKFALQGWLKHPDAREEDFNEVSGMLADIEFLDFVEELEEEQEE